MFQTAPLSIIRSFHCTHSNGICHKGLLTACSQAVSKPVWHIQLLCVQWKTPDDGQRNCPKHVEFYPKNTFEKLVHLVGFIVRTNIKFRVSEVCKIMLSPKFYHLRIMVMIWFLKTLVCLKAKWDDSTEIVAFHSIWEHVTSNIILQNNAWTLNLCLLKFCLSTTV